MRGGKTYPKHDRAYLGGDGKSMIPVEFFRIDFHNVTLVSTFTRLLLAAAFGGMVGMERGRKRRAAGLRTHMLVCMGAALVMITNQYISAEYGLGDPSRMGAQVISGIGFLGAGTIIVDRQQQVRGLTTAAGIWACACVGLSVGIGFYIGSIIAIAFILLTIVIINKLEPLVFSKSRVMEIYLEFALFSDINRFLNLVAHNGIKVIQMEIVPPRNQRGKEDVRAAIILTLQLSKKSIHTQILENFADAPGLLTIEELH